MKRPVSPEERKSAHDKGLSRRKIFKNAALAASALPLVDSITGRADAQQAAPAGQPAAGAAPGRGGPRVVPGGTGPIKVLLITKFHPFEREPIFLTFDSFGKDITWT